MDSRGARGISETVAAHPIQAAAVPAGPAPAGARDDPWRAAHFRRGRGLIALADGAGLRDTTVTGAMFCPPLGIATRLMDPIDAIIGHGILVGATFLVLTATMSAAPDDAKEWQ